MELVEKIFIILVLVVFVAIFGSLFLMLTGSVIRERKLQKYMEQLKVKEIYFNTYCATCKHQDLDEDQDPCDECLATPARIDSHKPINWEEK